MAQTVLVLLGYLVSLTFFDILEVKGVQLHAAVHTATCDQFLVELLDFHAHQDLQVGYVVGYY